MSRAHQSSDLALIGRPVVIDSPQTAHFSFNNGIASNGHPLFPMVDPVTRQLSGASIAVPGDDQAYDYSLANGLFGSGLAREESTINVYLYPAFEKSTADGGWSHWGQTGHIGSYGQNTDRQYVYYPWQTYSHWVSNGSTATGAYLVYQAPACENTWRSLQAIIKMDDGSEVTNDKCYPSWNASVSDGIPNNAWGAITSLGNGFYLCTAEGFHQDGTNDLVGIYVKPGYKIYISFVQMEDKAYCTELYHNPSASPEITQRTRPEVCLSYQPYPTRTWSSWIKSSSNKICSQPAKRTVIRQYDSLADVGWWVYAAPSGDPSYAQGTAVLEVTTSGKPTLRCSVADNITNMDSWRHITVELNTKSYTGAYQTARLWVNDTYAEIGDLTGYSFNYYSIPVNIGYMDTTDTAGNFVYDEMRLDSGTYSYDEIRRRYISKTEYYNPYGYGCITSPGKLVYYTWLDFENLSVEEQEAMTWNELEGL